MQISIETTSGLERRLTISVPSEQFEGRITERLGEAAVKARLPGFRPGKVPMKEMRRRYGRAVRAEVAGELMESSFIEAVRQESLTPAGSPSLEVVKMEPGIDFEFTATFEVYPQVELTDLGKVSVRRPTAEITEQDIDDMIERLREQRKTWEPVTREAADGDRITLDFQGAVDGEVFEGGTGEDARFVLGAGQMVEDFETGVRGMTAGAAGTFDVVFPEDYRAEPLRGKRATFEVTIKEVAEPRLPEVDAAFIEGFGVEEGGLDAFRADVRGNMQRELDGAIANQVKGQVMDQLRALHDVKLPGALVKREVEELKRQMFQQFQQPGARPADLPDLPDDLFLERAEQRVAVGLIVSEIVASARLEADPDQVRARIETLAEQYAEPQQVINYYYGNQEQLQQIEMAVLEDRVVDHILSAASVEEVPSDYASIIAGTALEPAESADASADAEPEALESAVPKDE